MSAVRAPYGGYGRPLLDALSAHPLPVRVHDTFDIGQIESAPNRIGQVQSSPNRRPGREFAGRSTTGHTDRGRQG
ncbi:hypothetical protein Pen02_25150 [Plantactinospora endophytica]|uniref:Uncharacterized protein n=1 Tax=Plantactinospora endophytica TaxID=673535 RepID=A0ABQ4DYQ0_9ACTN|nr:hypothetical protein Pen02_25150 [Plantactinospora endophytica]